MIFWRVEPIPLGVEGPLSPLVRSRRPIGKSWPDRLTFSQVFRRQGREFRKATKLSAATQPSTIATQMLRPCHRCFQLTEELLWRWHLLRWGRNWVSSASKAQNNHLFAAMKTFCRFFWPVRWMAGSELILPEWLLVIMAAAGVGQCGSVEVIREMFMPPSSLAPTATILCSAALSFCNGVYAATIHYTLVEIFGTVISEMFMPRSSMVACRAPLLLQL